MKGDKEYIKNCKFATEMADSFNNYVCMYCHHSFVNKVVLWKGQKISEECKNCCLFELKGSKKRTKIQ